MLRLQDSDDEHYETLCTKFSGLLHTRSMDDYPSESEDETLNFRQKLNKPRQKKQMIDIEKSHMKRYRNVGYFISARE